MLEIRYVMYVYYFLIRACCWASVDLYGVYIVERCKLGREGVTTTDYGVLHLICWRKETCSISTYSTYRRRSFILSVSLF